MNSLIFTTAALHCLWALSADGQLLVQLPHGQLRGRDHGTYYTFESVPYADPPVGDLRFEAPQPFSGVWNETFDASRPADECLQWSHFVVQPNKLTGSEDCLTVSIFKPKNASRSNFPVVAKIFGGAWSFGGSVEDGAREFMDSGNVMVVNINHRVGILGFANTGDSIMSGNYALKDQRMALHWIKDNIAYFGGDPNNILLMGFSSGAASVHFQLMHEDLKDVVKGVWSVSGSAVNPWAVQPSGINDAYKLAQLVGCGVPPNNAALKRCLKSVDAIELVNHFPKFLVYDYVPFAPFTPVVESIYAIDPFITKYPADIIKSGKTAQVPWLASYAPEDGIYDAALLLSRLPNGKERIGDLNLRWNELAPYFFAYQNTMNKTARDERSKEIKEKYIGKQRFSLDNYWQVQRMFTNEIFKNGIEKAVDLHRTYGKSPVYSYIYDNPADHSFGQLLAGRNDIFLGTGHGDDWFLMFSNTIREPLRADEKIVSWKLVKMVEDFLQDGHFVYDNCVFQDNVGQDQFQVVAIRRTTCDLLQSDNLPDTVSNNLPESPIVIYT